MPRVDAILGMDAINALGGVRVCLHTQAEILFSRDAATAVTAQVVSGVASSRAVTWSCVAVLVMPTCLRHVSQFWTRTLLHNLTAPREPCNGDGTLTLPSAEHRSPLFQHYLSCDRAGV